MAGRVRGRGPLECAGRKRSLAETEWPARGGEYLAALSTAFARLVVDGLPSDLRSKGPWCHDHRGAQARQALKMLPDLALRELSRRPARL